MATPDPPPIGAHRLLGDGRSSALIQPGGEVDWWCAPRLDSPPLLWSLLDQKGAAARWCDVRYVALAGGPAGPTARTVLRADGGRIETVDGLLHAGARTCALVRLVRAVDRPVQLVHELGLGGFDAPWVTWNGRSAAVANHEYLVLGGVLDPPGDGPGPMVRARVTAEVGRWAALVIVVDGALTDDADELLDLLHRAEAEHEAVLDTARLPRRHPERVRDALSVLRCCTDRETGAVVASPTTSLPEAPGHDRQFDYRYSWVRDASLAASVAALLGHLDVAHRYLGFLERQAADGRILAAVTTIDAADVPAEREVPGVAGWAGSQPVRVGNGARGQRQVDALGMVVEAVSVYLQQGGSLEPHIWTMVAGIADEVTIGMGEKTNGIWEIRDPKDLVSADIGRWLALDRAIWITRGWRPWVRRGRWKQARAAARDRVLAALDDDGGLPQSYDDPIAPGRPADASALMVPLFRMLDHRDPRADRLIDATLVALDAGPFVYRYEPGGDDGFSGIEGVFLPTSWWAVSALAAVGRVDEARLRADELCAQLPKLLPEELDPIRLQGLGNVPLVWSHMELARAMYVLHAADIRRRFGVAGLALWRVGRFAVLRAHPRHKPGDASGAPWEGDRP